jgi:hypothetical protein
VGRCVKFDTRLSQVSLKATVPARRRQPTRRCDRRGYTQSALLIGVEAGLGDAAALVCADIDIGR